MGALLRQLPHKTNLNCKATLCMFISDEMKSPAAIHLEENRRDLPACLAAAEEVVEITHNAAWIGRARCAISLPNKERLYPNTGTGRKLCTASSGTFHIYELAGSTKQEATLFGVVQENEGTPQRIQISLKPLAWLMLLSLCGK